MNRDAGGKDALKAIIQEQLAHVASSLFLTKSLAIIDNSAESKESFIAAALRISKRIALFIDRDLAQTVYEKIMEAIERNGSPPGTRRRFKRVAFSMKVRVRYDGSHSTLDSENLSEGGLYLKTKEPFPAGSEIEITLPLETGNRIHLTGVVVRKSDPFDDTPKRPSGMAVQFKEIRDEETEILRGFIQRALMHDGLESRGEGAMEPPSP
ncbi:MAG: PilZ domain-containing protein [Nitrospirae bacterium]|nr:PilZ domain-containing protein [Nitrospirota bacterium]